METIHHVRVMLFWNSEIARDAYGPYFTGVVRKSWTLSTIRMISHNELVSKNIEIPRYGSQSLDCSNDNEGSFILRKMRYLWIIPPHHAKEGIHILVEFEQIQQHSIPITHHKNTTNMTEHITAVTQKVSDEPSMLYTTINNDDDEFDESEGDDVVTENIMPQLESSQWFSSAIYDYTHFGEFLNMGSGSPIDDLVESGTIRLLDLHDSMTDIQLVMRFVDKV
ncbi:hypothetical protein M9H77_19529 [Catharanthus roseus]|uniref:Uncharacterized protein n=1 Tax=Catharanthus roseus TaxID=4058 RepID=A0ACC0BAJ8_CATRO|nr:hypothetical protein M9H77_19529 [Catharanthus roseus]